MDSKRWPVGLIAATFIVLAGCGGNSSTPAPAPTVTISISPASMPLGASATLTWSSTNAASCSASGAWSGVQEVGGSQKVTPTTAGSLTYSLACTGAVGAPSPRL